MINRDGYVVTNWHVISGADQISVQLADGRIAEPKLVGADPETELALLKIDLPRSARDHARPLRRASGR